MKVTVKIAEAHWYWRLWFWIKETFFGYKELRGFTTYWHTIVIRAKYAHDQSLIAHEVEHVRQIDRLGIWKFTVEYLKEQWRVGYRKNKFEIWARAAGERPAITLRGVQLTWRR